MVLTGLTIGCQKVPLTGRSQLKLVSNSELLPLSFSNYKGVLDTSSVVRTSGDAQMVQRVGNRLRQAMEQYLNANNLGSRLEGFQWEFNLIQSPQVNAWCMPGGKIAFYTGILEQLKLSDDEAAMIMGHEMAHALREHARARIAKSQGTGTLLSMGAQLFGLGQLGDVAANIGTQLLTLRFSREDETDADLVGLELAARGGFNPQASVSLWEKMGQASGGAGGPAFLSTHPSGPERIRQLQANVPKVQGLYQRAARG